MCDRQKDAGCRAAEDKSCARKRQRISANQSSGASSHAATQTQETNTRDANYGAALEYLVSQETEIESSQGTANSQASFVVANRLAHDRDHAREWLSQVEAVVDTRATPHFILYFCNRVAGNFDHFGSMGASRTLAKTIASFFFLEMVIDDLVRGEIDDTWMVHGKCLNPASSGILCHCAVNWSLQIVIPRFLDTKGESYIGKHAKLILLTRPAEHPLFFCDELEHYLKFCGAGIMWYLGGVMDMFPVDQFEKWFGSPYSKMPPSNLTPLPESAISRREALPPIVESANRHREAVVDMFAEALPGSNYSQSANSQAPPPTSQDVLRMRDPERRTADADCRIQSLVAHLCGSSILLEIYRMHASAKEQRAAHIRAVEMWSPGKHPDHGAFTAMVWGVLQSDTSLLSRAADDPDPMIVEARPRFQRLLLRENSIRERYQ